MGQQEAEQELFWQLEYAKGRWRKFTKKLVRRVRRYMRKRMKGKGKGKSGRRRMTGKSLSNYVTSLDDEVPRHLLR